MSHTQDKTDSPSKLNRLSQSGDDGLATESTSSQENHRQAKNVKSQVYDVNKTNKMIVWENRPYFDYPPISQPDLTIIGTTKSVKSTDYTFSAANDVRIEVVPQCTSSLSPKIINLHGMSPNRSLLTPPSIQFKDNKKLEPAEKGAIEDTRALVELLAELNRLGTTNRESSVLNFSSGFGLGSGVNRPPRSSLILLEDLTEQNARYDRWSVSSVSSDSQIKSRMGTTNNCLSPCPTSVATSRSAEKIVLVGRARHRCYPPEGGGIVRNSRSQEAYFNSGDNMTYVDIDLDDNMASSVDALHYDTSSAASLDSTGSVKTLGAYDWSNDHIDMVGLPEEDPREIACLLGFIPLTSTNEDLETACVDNSNTWEGVGNTTMVVNCEMRPVQTLAMKTGNDYIRAGQMGESPTVVVATHRYSYNGDNLNRSTGVHINDKSVAETSSRSDPPAPVKSVYSINKTPRSDRSQQQPGIARNFDEPDIAKLFNNFASSAAIKKPSIVDKPSAVKNSELLNSNVPKSVSMDDVKARNNVKTIWPADRLAADSHNWRVKPADTEVGTQRGNNINCSMNGEDTSEEKGASSLEYEALNCPTYVSREIDRPSAARLAKRLFFLHGFKKDDVTRHLSKK